MNKIQKKIISEILGEYVCKGSANITYDIQCKLIEKWQSDKWIKDVNKQFAEEEII